MGDGDPDEGKQQIYERVQGFAVDELEYFRKGLDDAITKKLGIKDPFLAAADRHVHRAVADQADRRQHAEGVLGQAAAAVLSGSSRGLSSISAAVGGLTSRELQRVHLLRQYPTLTPSAPRTSPAVTPGWPRTARAGQPAARLPCHAGGRDAAHARGCERQPADRLPALRPQRHAVTTEDLMREMDQRSRAAAQEATQSGIAQLIDQNRRSYGRLLSAGYAMPITYPRAMPASMATQGFRLKRNDFSSPENSGRLGGVQAGWPRWTAQWTGRHDDQADVRRDRGVARQPAGQPEDFLGRDLRRPYPLAHSSGFARMTDERGRSVHRRCSSWSQAIDSEGSPQ
jgi:hypothetical protein